MDNTIRVWDVTTGRTVAVWYEKDLLKANGISFGHAGTILLSGTPNRPSDDTFKIHRRSRMTRFLDFTKGQENWSLIWHSGAGGFSPDGTRFVHRDNLELDVRDALTGDLALILPPRSSWFGSAVFSPDGRTIAASGWFGAIGIYECEPPPEGYQIRKSAQAARILVDGLYERLKSYASVIENIQGDLSLDESMRQFALQISKSRLSAEQYYPFDE